jgi:hypothetical protein
MKASVIELEAEVAQSRQRLRESLEAVRSPERLAAFKAEIWQEKEDIVRKTGDAARDAAGRLLADAKARAMANPAAALSIGAGVAWHVLRHPPISALLIGLGIVSLAKTQPTGTSDRVVAQLGSQMTNAAEAAAATAKSWSNVTADAVQQRGERLMASSRELMHDTRDRVSELGERVAAQSAEAAKVASATLGRSWESVAQIAGDEAQRDQILLGAAAVSVLAAIGLAFRRPQP